MKEINLGELFTDSELKHAKKISLNIEKLETFIKTKIAFIDLKTGQENDSKQLWS